MYACSKMKMNYAVCLLTGDFSYVVLNDGVNTRLVN